MKNFHLIKSQCRNHPAYIAHGVAKKGIWCCFFFTQLTLLTSKTDKVDVCSVLQVDQMYVLRPTNILVNCDHTRNTVYIYEIVRDLIC